MANRQSKKKALHAIRLTRLAMIRRIAEGLRKVVENYPGQHPMGLVAHPLLSAKHVLDNGEKYRYGHSAEAKLVSAAPSDEDGFISPSTSSQPGLDGDELNNIDIPTDMLNRNPSLKGGFRRGELVIIGAATTAYRPDHKFDPLLVNGAAEKLVHASEQPEGYQVPAASHAASDAAGMPRAVSIEFGNGESATKLLFEKNKEYVEKNAIVHDIHMTKHREAYAAMAKEKDDENT